MIFFLDRDGTINIDYNFVHKPSEWTFCDGAPEAIRLLNEMGYKVVVVTNQSGIIRRRFTLAQVIGLHAWVDRELARHGARIDAWYIAPWHPDMHDGLAPDLLRDRKPDTGMFEKALKRFSLLNDAGKYHACHMAGDRQTDLEPALQLGMKPWLIRSVRYGEADPGWLASHRIPVYDRLLDVVHELKSGPASQSAPNTTIHLPGNN